MALAIATNNAALQAAASASSVNRDMETSMARLSSGKRINSARDDAAGVAIASRLSSEIRGTNQAIRNAMDGQALIDTAEGGHKEIENILQRMREISVQAANDTNDASDRKNLQAEMNALSTEIDRIASVTTWAGQNMISNGGSNYSFQVGTATGTKNQIAVTINSMSAGTLKVGGADPSVTTPQKVGGEFQVNTHTTGDQIEPSITALSNGGYVIAWSDGSGRDGDLQGIFAQVYGSNGNPLGSEFQVNSHTASVQSAPSITSLNDSGFVVIYHSNGGSADDSSYGVYGQRYDASGTEVGSEFLLNNVTSGDQKYPSVTSLSDGGFVAAWASLGQDGDDYGVYGQLFDSSGNKSGQEFRINSTTANSQNMVALTALADGSFVAAWQDESKDTNGYGIYGQLFDSSGGAVGIEFKINSRTSGNQTDVRLASLKSGGFAAVYTDAAGENGYDIYAKRFDSNGNALDTNDFLVNSTTSGTQADAGISALADGGFVITYTAAGLADDAGLYGVGAQRFDASGSRVGSEFMVNTTTADQQKYSAVAGLEDGNFVVSFSDASGKDGAGLGVFAQRFDAGVSTVPVGHAATARGTISQIDTAIKTVNTQRSELGAVSNRLSHTVNNLTNISANLSAAKGGIEDADFALETTQLAKNQILQQASTAMLAQANASKQNVLSLLQG
jgi:flagellin-like hook-associated protein FlgL